MYKSTLTCKMTMEEDFHNGSGYGLIGLYDDGQVKNRKGIPITNEDTFKGILKESCRQFELLQASWGNHEYDGLTSKIFATYANLASIDIFIEPVIIPDTLLIIHSHTAVCQDTNKAKTGSLRSIECGVKGIEYEVTIEYRDSSREDNHKEVQAFLESGLKMTKSIAGHKKRGLGAIAFSSIQTESKEIMSKPLTEQVANSLTNSVTIFFELLQDTHIGSRGQSGNMLFTTDYFNGASVLGMLRNPLLAQGLTPTFLNDDNVNASFFYPLPESWNPNDDVFPIIPVPLSLRKSKAYPVSKTSVAIPHWIVENTHSDFLKDIISQDTASVEHRQEIPNDKGIYRGYICNADKADRARHYYPDFSYHTRNAVIPERQATGADGLFIEERVVAHTKYFGTLTFSKDQHCRDFVSALQPWLDRIFYLHAGRGGRPVKIVTWMPSSREEDPKITKLPECFSITTLSDCILYDERLSPLTGITSAKMNILLGIPDSVELIRSVARNNIITSFSGTSGLRRFRDVAISKGSVFRFKILKPEHCALIYDKLANMQEKGIGSRRYEGFGKIVINHQLHQWKWNMAPPDQYLATKITLVETNNHIQKNDALHKRASILENKIRKIIGEKIAYRRYAGNLLTKLEYTDRSSFLSYLEQMLIIKQDHWIANDPRKQLTKLLKDELDELSEINNIPINYISIALRKALV
jgi:hypothetical protein